MAFFLTAKDIDKESRYSDSVHEEGRDCNQCQASGTSSVAYAFCPTCVNFLCHTCKTQHTKMFADHGVIIEDLSKSRDYINLKIHMSSTASQLEQTCVDAGNNISLAERYRNQAFEEIRTERENINKMFDEQKEKVNRKLDDLEANIKTKVLSKYDADYKKFNSVFKESIALKKDLESVRQNFDTLQQTPETFYDSMTQCQNDIAKLRPKVKQAALHNEVTKYRFEPQWQQNTVEMTVNNLGIIKTFDPLKATANVNLIHDINMTSSKDTEHCNIKGMCFFSKHFLAVVDSANKSLKIVHREQYNLVSEVAMPEGPRDITQVKDTQLAVTLPRNRLIRVLNFSRNHTVDKQHDIPVDGTCRGIVSNNGKLFVSFNFPTNHIQVLDMNGKVHRNFDTGHYAEDHEGRSSFAGIGQSPNHKMIYIADEKRDTITCMTTEGKVKAVYRSAYFEKPRGLTVACNGLVFASGKGKVHELSADLSHGRIVLDHTHDIRSVQCLLYCEHEKVLYVGMIGQNIIKKFQIV